MGRTAILALVLVLLAAAPARADIPAGDLVLRGLLRDAPGPKREVRGTLAIKRVGRSGTELTRRVTNPDGSTECWSGIAVATDTTLSATLIATDGIVDTLLGRRERRPAISVTYTLAELDGSLRGTIEKLAGPGAWTTCVEVARFNTTRLSKQKYFDFLDVEPSLQGLAQRDSLRGLLALLVRQDVPPALDRAYAAEAGSPGAGRVMLALDYTRGNDEPTWWDAIKAGPKRVVAGKVVGPMLTHFRSTATGRRLFTGDAGFARPFRDSPLNTPDTCQVGHLLCAVEAGMRQGHYRKHPLERHAFEVALRTAGFTFGLEGVKGTVEDWSRAGIIGHEMIGDSGGEGFLGQMNAYGRLVANGDPQGIREAWDLAVKAVLARDHLAAWSHIRKIARAAEIPETPQDAALNFANPRPRFARPGLKRGGNSLADLGLSVYGFALGLKAATTGHPTAAAARADFEAFLAFNGTERWAIERAADATR